MDDLTPSNEPFSPYARTFFWLWGLTLLAIAGFRTEDPTYRQYLDQWHRQRVESLKSENGWLNLAGLFWLKEGNNTVGADPGNDLTFPGGKAPAQLGVIRLTNGVVQFEAAPEVLVQTDGQPVPGEKTVFAPDLAKPVTLAHGSLRWFVIKRGDRYAVRLRDLESPLLRDFSGIDRFPVDDAFRVKAKLERPTEPRTIPILDITGQTSQQPLAGTLVFDLGEKTYPGLMRWERAAISCSSSSAMGPIRTRPTVRGGFCTPANQFSPMVRLRNILPWILTRVSTRPARLLRLPPVRCRRNKTG